MKTEIKQTKMQQQTSQTTPEHEDNNVRQQQNRQKHKSPRIKFLQILKQKELTNQNRLFFFKMATDFFGIVADYV